MLSVLQIAHCSETIEIYKARFKSEDEVLEYIIDEHIPVITIEHPNDRELTKKYLKLWNPHIHDWRNFGDYDKINIYKRRVLYDLSLGYHLYDNREKLSDSNSINTQNIGPTFAFRLSQTRGLNSYNYYEFRLQKKDNFILAENGEKYSFPMNHGVTLGYNWGPKKSFAQLGFGLSYEEISYLSYNNETYQDRQSVLENLEVATVKAFWGSIEMSYRVPYFSYGTYLSIQYGESLLAHKSLPNDVLREHMKAYKVECSLKFYFWNKFWMKAYSLIVKSQANTSIDHNQQGIYLGITF